MTQMGLVAMVEHAPPLSEAYTFARNQLSVSKTSMSSFPGSQMKWLTCSRPKESLRFVVYCQIDSPGRYVAQKHWSEPSIHAPKAFLVPYGSSSPMDTAVCSSSNFDPVF